MNGNLKLYILKIIYKFFIKFTDAAIVTSEFMRDEILKYHLKREKVFLIRNPISVEETRKNISPVRLNTNNLTLIFDRGQKSIILQQQGSAATLCCPTYTHYVL